jgi:hypothetical protein
VKKAKLAVNAALVLAAAFGAMISLYSAAEARPYRCENEVRAGCNLVPYWFQNGNGG